MRFVCIVFLCKYERGEAIPSIDAAKKIADAIEVSLDYLVGEEDKKKTLYDPIDTYILDAKARKAYS
jgi:transcriptional regulator with XRE-family HTH domain